MTGLLDAAVPEHASGAQFSDDGVYRYRLWRYFGSVHPEDHVLFCMLNPSKAGATKNDPTITRDIGFAKRWGFKGLMAVNFFAYCATFPGELYAAADPNGPENDKTIDAELAKPYGLIIAAWGNAPVIRILHQERIRYLLEERGAKCLGKTALGHPRHPVRLAYATELEAL